MALLTWNQRYSIGVTDVDEQHMKLFEIINKLHDAMKKGTGNQALGEILKSLVDYTKTHFSYEERLMRTYEFEGMKLHKAEHTDFIKKIEEAQRDFKDGRRTLSIELLSFLQDWLLEHIRKIDGQCGQFLVSQGYK